jgi:hypothetical protein
MHVRRKNDDAGRGDVESVASLLSHDAVGDSNKRGRKGLMYENIVNLLPPPPVVHHGHCHHPLNPDVNDPHDVAISKDDTDKVKPQLYQYKDLVDGEAIPMNARKPVVTCSGQLGVYGKSGVADPEKFVKVGSGSKLGPSVKKGVVSKPGEEVEKWERPLDKNFVKKLGRPKIKTAANDKDAGKDKRKVVKPKNFLAENKASSSNVVQVNKSEVVKPLVLGVMPEYLKQKRLEERVVEERAMSERSERKSVRKQVRRDNRAEIKELLSALKKRRDGVLVEVRRWEGKEGGIRRRKLLEVEVNMLDADIKKLGGA